MSLTITDAVACVAAHMDVDEIQLSDHAHHTSVIMLAADPYAFRMHMQGRDDRWVNEVTHHIWDALAEMEQCVPPEPEAQPRTPQIVATVEAIATLARVGLLTVPETRLRTQEAEALRQIVSLCALVGAQTQRGSGPDDPEGYIGIRHPHPDATNRGDDHD